MKTKKLLTLLLCIALIAVSLCACTKTTENSDGDIDQNATDVAASEIYFNDIIDVIDAVYAPSENGMYVIDEASVSGEFGDLDMSYFSKVYAYGELEYPNLDRIFLGLAKDKDSLKAATDALNAFPGKLIEIYNDYDAEAAKQAESAATKTAGLFVCFVVHEDCDGIVKTITDAIDYSKGLAEKEDVDNTISSVIDEKKGN